MKSKHLLLMLLIALMAPWAAMAQNTITLTGNVTQTIAPNTTYDFYDSGGPDGYYGNNQNYTATLTCVGDITINFSQFETENSSNCSDWDHMHIYDGTASNGTLLARGQSGCTTATLNTGIDYVATSGTMTIVWKSDSGTTKAGWAATITGGAAPACPKPMNLTSTATTGTPTATATFTWTNSGTETDWVLEYGTASDFIGASSQPISQSDLVNGKYTLTTGLTAETKYYAHIKADCGGGEVSDWSNTIEFKPSNVQTVPIGSGETTNSYLPAYTYNNNTLSEQIYTAAEIGMAGTINSIAFYNGGSTKSPNFKVYLVHTDKTAFSSATDWLTVTAGDLVFEGDVTLTVGQWTTIEFDTEFEYDGCSNLGLVVDEYMSYSSGLACRVFSSTDNCSMYVTSDGTNYNAVGASYSGSRLSVKNQLQLGIIPNLKPKPNNLALVDGSLSQTGATLEWQAPCTTSPTGYEYQYKIATDQWPATWTSNSTNLSMTLSGLTSSTTYDFRVRATYTEGESDPIEIQFSTLDACAVPTGFAATLVAGQGTVATFSWTKGFADDDDWVLQYGTDNEFTAGTYTEITDDFNTEGAPVITYNATGLTAETPYYARVKTDCGGTYSTWSDIYGPFTPSNYVDYTYGTNATTTNSYIPFYGYHADDDRTVSQYIIPATELGDVAGGTIRSLTYYTTSTPNWGEATVFVYVKEVEKTTFAGASAAYVEEWETMTQVYHGSLTVNNGQMTITFAEPYSYGGSNLMIGIKIDQEGTGSTVSWTTAYGSGNTGLYGYYYASNNTTYYYNSTSYPQTTINYLPTSTPRPIITEPIATTDATATINWTKPSDNVTGYKYQYKLASANWTDSWTELGSSATSVTLNTLSPTTDYDFCIKAIYSGGESVVSTTSFQTTCPAAYSVPYTCGFEGPNQSGSYAMPMCWTRLGTSTTLPYVYSSNSHTGSKDLYFYKYSGTNQNEIAVLPAMNANLNELRIVFFARLSSSSNDGTINIGYVTDLTDASTFQLVETVTLGTTYDEYKVSFGNLAAGTTGYIAMQTLYSTASATIYVDDVTVEPIPSCLEPNVPEYVAGSADTESAKITWTPNGNETSWDLYWSTSATAPISSTAPMAESVTMTDNEYTIGSLNASTKYYVWVRAHCSATDQSAWSGPCSFTTACVARTITEAEPYSEGFEGYTGTAYNATNGELPVCWDSYTTNSSNIAPHIIGSGTGSYIYLHEGTNALTFYGSGYCYAAMPEFTNALCALQIKFWMQCENSSNGTLTLGYITAEDDGTFNTFTAVPNVTIANNSGSMVERGPYYLNEIPATATRLVFRWYWSSQYSCCIDDVEVSLIPSCWQPQNLAASNVTNEAATFTWERHAMSTETSWVLQYGTDETFATYLDQVTVNTDPTYEIESGLTASTTYYVRVKPACDTDGELWSEVLEFETEADCAAPTVAVTEGSETASGATITWNGRNDSYAVEYREVITAAVEFDETYDFEDNSLQGWTTISNDNDNNAWTVQSTSSYAHGGTYFARSRYTGSGDGVANDWLISPQIPLGGTFSFYARRYGTSYTDQFQVYVSTTDNNISSFTAISEVITPNPTYDLYEYDLSSYSGYGYVAIVYTAPNNQYYVYVDDIHITASIAGEYGAWQPVSDANPTSPYTFSTLNDNTTYEARVKGYCDNVESDYSEVVCFTTLEACPVPTEFALGTVTTETAAISWNGGVATEWKVWIKESTETEYPSTYSTVSTASKTFDGLDDNTTYDVKIVPTCDVTKYLEVEEAFTTLDACPAPTGFTLGTVTDNSAAFSWTQPDNGVSINEWTVKYKKSSETEYTNAPNVTGTPSTTLGNLDASSTYQVVIAPACNDEKTLVGSFRTTCGIYTLPYTYGFEDADELECWTMTDCISSTGINSSANHTGSKGFRFYWVSNSQQCLISPEFDCTTQMAVSFYYMNSSSNWDETFRVGYSTTTNDVAAFTWRDEITADENAWTLYSDVFPVGTKYVALKHTSDNRFYLYVDDFSFQPAVTLTVPGYGEGNEGGYVFIASPLVDDIAPSAVTNLVNNEIPANYDLFSFDQAADMQWVNSKNDNAFVLSNGQGYLYASKEDVTLTFTGVMNNNDEQAVPLIAVDNKDFTGWNLVGNPFPVAATVDKPYYKMNSAGDNVEGVENGDPVPACTGIMVYAESDDDEVTFTKVTEQSSAPNNGSLNIAVAQANSRGNGIQDNVIVSFNQGSRLGKFIFNANKAKLYIPQDGKDYAVVSAETQGELPLNFKAVENGSYTLSFNAVGTEFSYLHLIDNLTGNNVDLLATPSYSFNACTTDYASRFRLVFAKADANSDNFAFISNGEIILSGVNGNSTVQMFDVTGRMVNSSNGNSHIAIGDMAAGVYMIRLINGNDVKTQKIVVR